MIETFRAERYGCLRDVRAELSRLHALIGPNDSGKSTLLRALEALTTRVGRFDPQRVEPANLGDRTRLEVTFDDGVAYGLSWAETKEGWVVLTETARDPAGLVLLQEERGRPDHWSMLDRHRDEPSLSALRKRLAPARMLRLEPDALREPSDIFPQTALVDFVDEHGKGLPSIYDAILNRDVEAFTAILSDVRRLFPWVKKVGLTNLGGATKALEATLADGAVVRASHMSEGLLYYLAFRALSFLAPPSVFLVEEPENGLHPARIGDVMRVLRDVSKTAQILLATHSPLVINEMEPDEVSVVTRTGALGTKVTRMKDTPSFAKRASVYSLGELWLSYADGVEEAPLLEGAARP